MKTGVEMLPVEQSDREAAASNIARRLSWQHGGYQPWIDASTASTRMGEQDDHDEVQAFARHRLNTHPAATGSVRGWKLVPVEPTSKMVAVGWGLSDMMVDHSTHDWRSEMRTAWSAMLDAAPKAPTPDAAASDAAVPAGLAHEHLRTIEPVRFIDDHGDPGLLYTAQQVVDAFKAGAAAAPKVASDTDAAASEAGEVEKPLSREDLYRFMDTLKLSEKREVAKTIGFDAAYVASERDFDRWKRMWLWAADNDKKSALATAIRAALTTQGGAEG